MIHKIKKEYLSRSGKNHWNFKGNQVGYGALHDWIVKIAGSAITCEKCGKSEKPIGKKRWFEWSNKTGKYNRELKNWWQLCISCHRIYDKWGEKMKKYKGWEKNKVSRDKNNGRFIRVL